ncbi:ABC-three component system protein [Erwinia tasmaniensis]|uniref:ABC-three component systems C-terminal domain-containing protein n=1 Tax=Erwinia tasmaniensis (strain DSM 17950 / CFBP 7177 / CIP 109463 / NCPPB 4357 / Et1/99) TaxID=465817 RepID=B2VEW0_ERWT9|nr:ABC-three component system protein [Erwinia tasmaniensis]CAO96785.1 hypothetical protein ETA_17390 [Erwinia tasmaniensis Et1/99]
MTVSNKTKGMLFDATNSWNGYSYQGRVGLYICLSTIARLLVNGDQAELDEISRYSLEYEWLEDFALLRDEEYISLHQVKHYNEAQFSNYISAFTTIFDRKLGKVSGQDLELYLRARFNSNGDNKEKLAETVENIMSSFVSDQVTDEDHYLSVPYKNYSGQYRDEVSLYLKDAINISNIFKRCPVYIHTSLEIGRMKKPTILCYDAFSKIQNRVENKSEPVLEKNCIFHKLKQGSGVNFELSLSDSELNEKIDSLIKGLLNILCPNTLEKTNELYQYHLLSLIDTHIQDRHGDLKNKMTSGYLSQAKKRISFLPVLDILRKKLVEQNLAHWQLLCKKNIYLAYNGYSEILQNLLNNQNASDEEIKQCRLEVDALEHYFSLIKERFLDKGKAIELLERLHFNRSNPTYPRDSNFYHYISEMNYLHSNFFSFLVELNVRGDNPILFTTSTDQIYHASAVRLCKRVRGNISTELNKFRMGIEDHSGMISLGVSHIILDCEEADGQTAMLKKIIDVSNVIDKECDDSNSISSGKSIFLIHRDTARDNLNE